MRERRGNRPVVEVPQPGRAAIRIDKVQVPQMRAAGLQRLCDVDFLDVHVKQVGQQLDVGGRERRDQIEPGGDVCNQVRFIAIDRLEQQRNRVLPGVLPQLVERLAEQPQRRRSVDLFAAAPLHRSDDHRCDQRAGEIDHRANERPGLAAFFGFRKGEVQPSLDPAGAGADRGQRQTVIAQQFAQGLDADCVGAGRKDFDRIEAQLPRFAAGAGQIVPKDERPTPGLGNQADRDTGADHAFLRVGSLVLGW